MKDFTDKHLPGNAIRPVAVKSRTISDPTKIQPPLSPPIPPKSQLEMLIPKTQPPPKPPPRPARHFRSQSWDQNKFEKTDATTLYIVPSAHSTYDTDGMASSANTDKQSQPDLGGSFAVGSDFIEAKTVDADVDGM